MREFGFCIHYNTLIFHFFLKKRKKNLLFDMNANCLSCFAVVPYVNGLRPKFCTECGKSMALGISVPNPTPTKIAAPKFKKTVQQEESDEYEICEDPSSLVIKAEIVGTSSNKTITLGQVASAQEGSFNYGARPAYEGDPLAEMKAANNSRISIDE